MNNGRYLSFAEPELPGENPLFSPFSFRQHLPDLPDFFLSQLRAPMLLAPGSPTVTIPVRGVLLGRTGAEMRRIDAAFQPTGMTHLQALGNGAVDELPGCPVHEIAFTANGPAAVPIRMNPARP